MGFYDINGHIGWWCAKIRTVFTYQEVHAKDTGRIKEITWKIREKTLVLRGIEWLFETYIEVGEKVADPDPVFQSQALSYY